MKPATKPTPVDVIAFAKAVDDAETVAALVAVEIKINRAIGHLLDYARTYTTARSQKSQAEYQTELRKLLDIVDSKKAQFYAIA